MNQSKQQHHRFSGGYKQNRPFKKQPQRVQVTLEPGHLSFRLLCPVFVTGGVIGHSGNVVKNLERDTGARILVEDALAPDSEERLIYVVGCEAIDRDISFRDGSGQVQGDGAVETGDLFNVSTAQEGLVRVFERILEIQAAEGGGRRNAVVCCRLLAVTDQIGAVMGKEGKIIDKIRRESGAYIRVFSAEQLPPCADPSDELIQITGNSFAVKKALLAVTRRLQERPARDKASTAMSTLAVNVSSYTSIQAPQTQSQLSDGSSFSCLQENMVMCGSEFSSSLESRGSYHNVDRPSTVEVLFRMLCPSDVAGGVIGKGGGIVKALQDETGASIIFAAPVAGCSERVISISSSETAELCDSPAQNAVIRVFIRSVEALSKTGPVSGWNGKGEAANATARLLIPSNQAGCLIGVKGTVISEMQKLTGSRIQLFEGVQVPVCASSDERLVQIIGMYKSVQNALFEVTCRLREFLFMSKGLNISQTRSYASYPAPEFLPMGGTKDATRTISSAPLDTTSRFETSEVEHKMDGLKLSPSENDAPWPMLFPHQNFEGQRNLTTSRGSAELSSEEKPAIVTNVTVEMMVPEKIFVSIFDSNGCNLARIEEISGATVELHCPCPGGEGKVIISGTPDQTLAGQSLLRAHILTVKRT